MWWMESCRTPSYRWCWVMRSSASSPRRANGRITFAWGIAWGFPGLATPAAHAATASTKEKNLCNRPGFTGYTLDGGYAEYMLADQHYCFPIPAAYGDAEAAPLLCAGLIGYRSLVLAGDARRLGIYGIGAAAHIVIQVARHQGRQVYAFTRAGDVEGQRFARDLGATWIGESTSLPPEELDAAILYAPVGALVPAALQAVAKGGTVVCAGIHMSDIPSFPYRLLWGERTVRSVANLTRRDGEEFLDLAPRIPVRTEIQTFPLAEANDALKRLRDGNIRGAAVLVIGE
jgi:propanol-preferring alcohol dehydrogenase